jgi:uncharacterized protein
VKTLIVTLIAVAVVSGCAKADLYPITIGSVEIEVEVVDTEETRARGLMFRESVSENEGMLFVFEQSEPRAFYMKNTSVPLSIAYIDDRLIIRSIHDMQPFSLETVLSGSPAKYALEVNQGAFATWGVSVGDRLIFSDELRQRIRQ